MQAKIEKKTGTKKITTRYRLEYVLFMAFVTMVKVSPLFMMKFNRKVLKFIFEKFAKRHQRIVDKNLRIVFPGESEETISGLKEGIYRHFSTIMVEIIFMFVKKNPEKILKSLELTGLHHLEEALKKQKGVILFSAHFGNWELIPYILSRKLNRQIYSIAREMNNSLVERKVKQFREFMGSSIIYKQNSIRSVLKRLKENEIVYLLIDQNTIEREAVHVDFFGEKVCAVPTVAQLNIKKDIPAVPVFVGYEKDKIVVELMEPVQVVSTGVQSDDICRLTQALMSIIEEKIKQRPEQWFWFHDRWKTKHKRANAGTRRNQKDEKESKR